MSDIMKYNNNNIIYNILPMAYSLSWLWHTVTHISHVCVKSWSVSGYARHHCHYTYHPSKHGTLTQWLFNVGPASQTLCQHWTTIGSTSNASRYMIHAYNTVTSTTMYVHTAHINHASCNISANLTCFAGCLNFSAVFIFTNLAWASAKCVKKGARVVDCEPAWTIIGWMDGTQLLVLKHVNSYRKSHRNVTWNGVFLENTHVYNISKEIWKWDYCGGL